MKSLIVALLLFCGSAQASEVANYKGYLKVSDQLFQNVFDIHNYTDDSGTNLPIFELGSFIDENFSKFSSSLLNLTGFYPMGLDHGEMRNGEPNSVSLMVYYFLFHNVAERVSEDCSVIEDPVVVQYYQQNFYTWLRRVCSYSDADELTEADYFESWRSFHAFSAPLEEYQAWVNFHDSQTYSDRSEEVYSLVLTALMNPYTIIEN
ncbi:MAG: hypothetical protein HRT44_05960 [Bdellovibrionales bacterium]|nr:hypothetical protein [Bdellovibrionales bacterium]NQZ18787.1 hypothetical protein [Bdellovibrionales bacterium]